MAAEFVNFGIRGNVKETMDIQTEKLLLIEELTKVQDAGVIAEIRRLLQERYDPVVGYDLNGEPITRSQLVKQVEEAESEIARGEYVTQEDIERESRNWVLGK